jgi:proline dehydrogenase
MWSRVINRFEKVCKKAYENNIKILIDAEEVDVQKAIDDLADFNDEKVQFTNPIVFNTVQMYRKDRLHT